VDSTIRLAGRVVAITGAGRGLGRAYAVELVGRGARVVVNDVSADHADALVAGLGDAAVASHGSVADVEGAAEVVQVAHRRFGGLDAVVNNAGFMRNAYVEEMDPADFDRVLAVHVRGSWLVTRAAWPLLRTRGHGRVVMTSSAGGLFAMQAESNYAAAKAGAYGLCRALAFEGRRHGIGVNAVLPMATSRLESEQAVPDYDAHYPAGVRERLAPRRLTEAVAPLIAYLVSTQCSLTGQAFSAGFGRFARVFVGETPGWVAPDPAGVTAEDVAAHVQDICRLDGFAVPESIYDEVRFIAERVGDG